MILYKKIPECDFCGSLDITWDYPATDFEMPFDIGSKGDWAACSICHDLIEDSNIVALTDRSVQCFLDKHPDWHTDQVTVHAFISSTHVMFVKHRIGPAIPVTKEKNDSSNNT